GAVIAIEFRCEQQCTPVLQYNQSLVQGEREMRIAATNGQESTNSLAAITAGNPGTVEPRRETPGCAVQWPA
ncbi:MAG: hypothetical protein ACK6D5_12610, partial [Planctomyces sp.]